MGKKCDVCKKKCTGDILKSQDKYFHIDCFVCRDCGRHLNETGFYVTPEGVYLCPQDYRGEQLKAAQGVDAAPAAIIPTQKPTQRPTELAHQGATSPQRTRSPVSPQTCAACDQSLHTGQVLLALGEAWHVYCFKCAECGAVLHGEYMSHEGRPLCLRDYNEKHGVRCCECHKFIAGKVLQAGGYKFHPTCARCSRCGAHFGDGQEMYMQGDEIWHPHCETSRTTENIAPSKTSNLTSKRTDPKYQAAFGQHLTYTYLLPDAEETNLKHPIPPHDPQAPQFHVPQGPIKIRKSRMALLKTGMQRLTEDMVKDQLPRAKSPHMDNEEPIELAHYPAAQVPDPKTLPAIEREDFPAPPFPYAVEELRRRLSTSSVENEISSDEEDGDHAHDNEEKLKKTVKQLEQYEDSSIAAVIRQNIEESQKKQKLHLHWDPRNASRTPSAKKMPHLRFRYDTPVNASPSRHLNRPQPWRAWQGTMGGKQGNTMPCFHVPESRSSTLRANTLPTGYYGHSLENLDVTVEAAPMRQDLGESRPGLRSSLPDMSRPVKTYPLATLQTTNKNVPEECDRNHLERHLNRDEFEEVFGMAPIEFYKLPEWKRINMKRKIKLF
ncbi:unnamed protein product, partial [Mesorhabditis spiculigera]